MTGQEAVQPPKTSEIPPSKIPDLQPENAIQRIKQRNLFNPTRGVIPEGAAGSAISQAKWPVLVGTTVAGKARFAMLRWAAGADAVSVEKGKSHEGFEVADIEADRVQVKYLATQETTWISLEQPGEGKTTGVSELQTLLGGMKPQPRPTPPAGNTK